MKRLTLKLKIENAVVEKSRLANILPCINTATNAGNKVFVPLRPLTEVRDRKGANRRISSEDRNESVSRVTPTVMNVKKINIPKNRINLNFRKTLIRYNKTTNMTQTESPDKKDWEFDDKEN